VETIPITLPEERRKVPFRLAVASGKGGTGKSCVAASLILAAEDRVLAVDADVECPNLGGLLDWEKWESAPVRIPRPQVDPDRCDGCGACADACRFSAMLVFGKGPARVNDLCHGCGACALVCPKGAIFEEGLPVGWMTRGRGRGRDVLEGRLSVGQADPVPVLEELLAVAVGEGRDLVVDCPPGTSCSLVAALRLCSEALFVTECTPFGAADLSLALDVAEALQKPAMVVLNRSDLGDGGAEELCRRRNIPVVARFPFSRAIAEAYASGIPPYLVDEAWRSAMDALWAELKERSR
jgi:MinD superfamily P-loop ATPase